MKFIFCINKKHAMIIAVSILILVAGIFVYASASPGKPANQMGHSSLFVDTMKSYYTTNTITIGDDATSKLLVTGDLNVVGKITSGTTHSGLDATGTITKDEIVKYCADSNGCEIRMVASKGTNFAVTSFTFYYDTTKKWIASGGLTATSSSVTMSSVSKTNSDSTSDIIATLTVGTGNCRFYDGEGQTTDVTEDFSLVATTLASSDICKLFISD